MEASKYLSGIDLQPVSIETAQGSIPGYELKMRWLDIGQPDAPRIGDPFLIDEESLESLVEALQAQIRQLRVEEGRAGWSIQ